MEISKTQKKRQARMVEELARELVSLPASILSQLPCEQEIREQIRAAQLISKLNARKRQIKYLAKCLRDTEVSPLLDFLEETRESSLRQEAISERLSRLRDRILHEEEEEEALLLVQEEFPEIDLDRLRFLAEKFRQSRNQRFSREIFRLLKIAQSHAAADAVSVSAGSCGREGRVDRASRVRELDNGELDEVSDEEEQG